MIKKLLLYLWQLPQTFIGIIIKWVLRPDCLSKFSHSKHPLCKPIIYESKKIPSSFSLGTMIFIKYPVFSNTILHEYGHSIQSQYLGFFYIPVIAIPSLLHNIAHRICRNIGISWDYYSFYTEKWANNLV